MATYRSSKRRFDDEQTDILTLFFQDVAQLPIVGGRNAYLPLTRRIQRGSVLSHLQADDPEQTLQNLLRAIEQTLAKLGRLCMAVGQQNLEVSQLASEIEPFLDDPAQESTPTLSALLNRIKRHNGAAFEQAEELAWRCFYLVSLVPPEQRAQFPDILPSAEVSQHFQRVSLEAEQATSELVQGSLRYVIVIARLYIGQGVPYLELVQEGFMGLLRATQTYNERRSHLQQYASQWIRQKITRYVQDACSLIRVPIHYQEEMSQVRNTWNELEELKGRPLFETELYEAAGWLKADQEDGVAAGKPVQDDAVRQKSKRKALRKAREKLRAYQVLTLPPYSLESGELRLAAHDAEVDDSLANMLVDPIDYAFSIEDQVSYTSIVEIIKPILSEREFEVLQLRMGLDGCEECTLEEIGERFWVTRERIRQIEAKAHVKLKNCREVRLLRRNAVLLANSDTRVLQVVEQQRIRLRKTINLYEEFHSIEDSSAVAEETARVDHLIEKYVERGRRRVWDTRRRGGRGALLREVLEELGRPTHYSLIHEAAMERVPEALQFSKSRTYSTMFYSDQFRLYGEGTFGLASWDSAVLSDAGHKVFQHCPVPLLPDNPPPNAFFDSVMLGRDLLATQTWLAAPFWREMQGWANHNGSAVHVAQDAFDAWYAAGLVSPINFIADHNAPLTLTLEADAKLAQVREYCLNMMCQRVLKMPELLQVLALIPRPTIGVIQKVLFGGGKGGFDVPMRLALLASLGAVQQVGGEWRITEIGRAALATNPPQDLPDFAEAETLDSDDEAATQLEWDYADLGLLEL